jgi:hypothetical protein
MIVDRLGRGQRSALTEAQFPAICSSLFEKALVERIPPLFL